MRKDAIACGSLIGPAGESVVSDYEWIGADHEMKFNASVKSAKILYRSVYPRSTQGSDLAQIVNKNDPLLAVPQRQGKSASISLLVISSTE